MKYTKEEILDTFTVGFEFEMLSKLSKNDIIKSIGKECGVKVIIPKEVDGFNKMKVKAHSKFTPTENEWKLEPDHSGDENGSEMHELVTGPLPYKIARIQLIKINNWIKSNAYTTKKTGIHLNFGYKNIKLGLKNTILTMNPLKLCLIFDENFIYSRFPKRKDNVYAKSIKQIYPANKFYSNDNIQSINPSEFLIPSTKYYGINFIKQQKNYLELRYIGGQDYEKKTTQILEIMEYAALTIQTAVENPQLSHEDRIKLSEIITSHKKMVSSFTDFKRFIVSYPKISVMVNLDGRKEVVETFYMSYLRDKIYDLIVKGKMKEGMINYDTENGSIQIRDAILKKCDDLTGFTFVNCNVEGIFYDCSFYNCTVENSQFNDSKIMSTNVISGCKINKTIVGVGNEIKESYIDCKGMQISGELTKCIIRNGDISHLAKLIDCTKISDD